MAVSQKVNEPESICITTNIPVDIKVKFYMKDSSNNTFYEDEQYIVLFSMEHGCVSIYTFDGDEWCEDRMCPFIEKQGGLYIWANRGWSLFPSEVQEAYASYVAEGALLTNDRPKKKVKS